MNTTEPHDDYGKLTHQQQRFCDEYLSHFNAFKAAVNSGYSENTSRKGALLHVPKIQQYLKETMNRRSQRLEITHDMILRELSKIAFSNMGNYYDEYGCLKRMNELTVDEKGAIAYYDLIEIQDGEGYRVGQQSRIKLHNKMSALDKIARHLNFYGSIGKPGVERQATSCKPQEEAAVSDKPHAASIYTAGESLKPEACGVELKAVVDRGTNNLPMDYPAEDFELEGIDLKTQMALEGVNVSPGRELMIEGLNDGMIEWGESWQSESPESGVESVESEVVGGSQKSFLRQASAFQLKTENMENILTISPLVKSQNSKVKIQNDLPGDDGVREFALGMRADTGCGMGSGQAVAKARAV